MANEGRDFPAERAEFERATGSAITAMGDVEHLTEFAIFHLGGSAHRKTVGRMGLSQKLTFLGELIDGWGDEGEPVRRFVQGAQKLIDERNIIAHSPLVWLLNDEAKDNFGFVAKKSGRVMVIDDIVEVARRAAALCDGFYLMVLNLSGKRGLTLQLAETPAAPARPRGGD